MKTLICFLLAASLFSISSKKANGQSGSSANPQAEAAAPPQSAREEATIPGPLRSFLRMAGISQKATADEVLPLLARNVVIDGYHGPQDRPGRPTEFLLLLMRYVQQARELQALAGPEGEIRVSNCDEAGPLLAVLGYRFRGDCPKDPALEASNSERAFLTIDSGFPLPELEEKLKAGATFTYPFSATQVPVIFTQNDWAATDKNAASGRDADVVELLMRNRNVARLYWAVSRLDSTTAAVLEQ